MLRNLALFILMLWMSGAHGAPKVCGEYLKYVKLTDDSLPHAANLDVIDLKKTEENGGFPVDRLGRSELFHAVLCGDSEHAAKILSAGASPDYANNNGDTPLFAAALLNQLHLIPLLKEHGANSEVENSKGESARTACEMGGHPELLDLL